MRKRDVVHLGVIQYELFWINYMEAKTSGDKESIHQLRVSLKRFYALKKFFLHGMNSLGQAQIKNYFEPLHLVYRAGGKVRDLQVITDVALNTAPYQAPSELLAQLSLICQQRMESFFALAQAVKLPTQQEFTYYLQLYMDEYYKNSGNKLERFIDENIKVARYYISGTDPGELWHDARTLIKQNYLIMQLAASIEPSRFSTNDIQYYRILEQMLGEWHDWMVLKKYALRYKTTRAYDHDFYFLQVSRNMKVLEKEILNVV